MNNQEYNLYSNASAKTREEYQRAYEKYEIEYWCMKFGVSSDRLKQAIASVGVSVDAVERYLKLNGFIR